MKTLLNSISLAALFALPLTGVTAEPTTQSTNQMHKVVFEIAMDGACGPWSTPGTSAASSKSD